MIKLSTGSLKYAVVSGVTSAFLCALLWFSLFKVPFLSIFCGIGVVVPVLFTQFSRNLTDAVIASLIAAVILCFILPLDIALLFSAFFFPPALLSGWLMGLKVSKNSQTQGETGAGRPESKAGYYPLSAAVFQLALACAFVTIGIALYLFNLAGISPFFDSWADRIISVTQNTPFYDTLAQNGNPREIMRDFLPAALAVSLAVYGFLFQLAALYCSMRLAASKKLLKRPLCVWPSELRLPPLALILFILLWLAAFFTEGNTDSGASTLALCLGIIASVLSAGFCLSGLAAVHQATPGPLIWVRALIYICLFSIALTPIIIPGLIIMGLFATPFRPLKIGGNSSTH